MYIFKNENQWSKVFFSDVINYSKGQVMCPFQNVFIFIHSNKLHRNNSIQNIIGNGKSDKQDEK